MVLSLYLCSVTVWESQYEAQSNVYVTLNIAANPFWWFREKKQKQRKQLFRRLEVHPSHNRQKTSSIRQMC